MKRTIRGAAVLMLALATITLPAAADPVAEEDNGGGSVRDSIGSTAWLEDAPERPVQLGTPAVTAVDKIALVEFEKEFPWKEAFASFGCEVSYIDINDEGGKSMLLHCAEASIPLDEVGQIPATAVAAAEGYPSAIAALQAGTIVDAEALSIEIREARGTQGDE